jgi:hypothetical protein
MKKILVLCGALMLVASTAFAQQGLHMRWLGCANNAASSPTEDFTCDGTPHNLHGTFSVAASTPGVVAMDGIIDLLYQTPDVPAFWQFQAGACNESGLALADSKPTVGCGTALQNTTTLCGTGGTGCDAFITAYAYGAVINFPANRARLLFTLARASTSPVTLAASVAPNAHFAFLFTFFEDNATEIGGACDGCLTGVSMTWNQAVLYNTNATTGGEGIAASISSADPGSADAHSFSNCPGCSAVSTKARSWGQLKSLYR